MPTYEYQCGTCGNRFEKFQSFNDEPIKVCPECGNAVKKVVSAAGIIFKGSGFYINDSRKATSTTTSSDSSKSEAAKTTSESTNTTSSGESSSPATAPAASAESAKPAGKTEAA